MTPERWEATGAYLREVFGREDSALRGLRERAAAEGLPDIAISAEVGRLLSVVAGLTGGGRGPSLVVEVGTLGGYSTLWLARALAPGGRVITVEMEERHAAFAEREFASAGVADRVEVRRGPALEVLPRLAREVGERSVDFVFIDAEKREYAAYYRLLKPLLKVGGVFAADNVLGSGSWWIDGAAGESEQRDAVDAFNRMVASDPEMEAAVVPVRQGVMIARRVRSLLGGPADGGFEVGHAEGEGDHGGAVGRGAGEDAVVPGAVVGAGFEDEVVDAAAVLGALVLGEEFDGEGGVVVGEVEVVRRDAVGGDVGAGLGAALLEPVPVDDEGVEGGADVGGGAAAGEEEDGLGGEHASDGAGDAVALAAGVAGIDDGAGGGA